jgi:excisionase family DNA binding protein
MAREIERQLYTVGEVADLPACSHSTVWRDISSGRLSVVHIAGRTRITRASLETLLERGAPIEAKRKQRAPLRLVDASADGASPGVEGHLAGWLGGLGWRGADAGGRAPARGSRRGIGGRRARLRLLAGG